VLRCCSDMHIRGEEGVYAAILEPIVYETATWHNPTLSTQFLQTFIGEFISMGLPGNPALLIGDAFLRHGNGSTQLLRSVKPHPNELGYSV